MSASHRGRGPGRSGEEERAAEAADGVGVDDALLDVAAAGDLVHDVEEAVLEDGAEAAGAGLVAEGLFGGGFEGVLGEDELDVVELEELLELAGERVLGLGEDADERVLVEGLQRDDDGDTADELGNEAVGEEVVVRDLGQQFVGDLVLVDVLIFGRW